MHDEQTHRADLDKDPEQVAAMFDAVAPTYDLTNDLISLGQVRVWRRALNKALGLPSRERVRILDVACGTGTSSRAMRAAGADVVGLDFSEGMLDVARRTGSDIEFVAASATELPFADDSFDAATISFGLRNVDHPETALREMARVVRPGGQVVVCEFSTPNALVRPFHGFYLRYGSPLAARLASRAGGAYDYLSESILDWPDQQQLGEMMLQAGLASVEYRDLTFGTVAIHRGSKPFV